MRWPRPNDNVFCVCGESEQSLSTIADVDLSRRLWPINSTGAQRKLTQIIIICYKCTEFYFFRGLIGVCSMEKKGKLKISFDPKLNFHFAEEKKKSCHKSAQCNGKTCNHYHTFRGLLHNIHFVRRWFLFCSICFVHKLIIILSYMVVYVYNGE